MDADALALAARLHFDALRDGRHRCRLYDGDGQLLATLRVAFTFHLFPGGEPPDTLDCAVEECVLPAGTVRAQPDPNARPDCDDITRTYTPARDPDAYGLAHADALDATRGAARGAAHAASVPDLPEGYDALANAKWGAITQSSARTLDLDAGHQRERPFSHAHVHTHRARNTLTHNHPHGHGRRERVGGEIRGGDHHAIKDPRAEPRGDA